MKNVEYVLKVNDYLNESIRFADTKAEVLLTIVSLVGACTGATAPTVLSAGRSSSILFFLMLAFSLVLSGSILTAVYAATRALAPRLQRSKGSLRSFPDASLMNPTRYVDEMTSLDEQQMARDVANHNAGLSVIAQTKFSALVWAARSVGLAIVCASLLAITYVIASLQS